MNQYEFPVIAFTIENQLEAYCNAERHTQRHETLWHAWNQDKRWLSQLLELTLPAFPTYSRHDESHAKSVLHNIERLLGEERIKQLSASDCFMILHVAYLHDIGMCMTADDRKQILNDDMFVDMVDRIAEEGDERSRWAAEILKKSHYVEESNLRYIDRSKQLKEKYAEKLDTYYAVIYLMAEYQRRSHGEKSKTRIHDWTMHPDQLGTGFSMSGIPLRLFLRIADCAALHTNWNFSDILELPMEDSGYAHDMIHPRFVTVMLQLGDALDIDNDRFHLFTKPFVGELPETSEIHFQKHQSIRQLQISSEEIIIEADCRTQDALRLVRRECDAIEDILKSASYHWAEISPKDLKGCLPTMRPPKIKLGGNAIPIELVTAKFNIPQKKAFQLLEGANVYFEHFAFLRELLQNAIDATKLQYFQDFKSRSGIRLSKRRRNISDLDFKELINQQDVVSYPIEIHFKIVGRLQEKNQAEDEYITVDEWKDYDESQIELGVLVSVRDYGTGISKRDLADMSQVGSSYNTKKRRIYEMPEWMQPTGQFGIGLQSVFLVCRSFKAYTRTQSNERYEISFNSAVNQGGYINTKPSEVKKNETCGTMFEVFVSQKYKLPHVQCLDAWNLEDPNSDRFSADYEANRPLRHSQELLTQMVTYVNRLVGEMIFPIYLYVEADGIDENYMQFVKRNANKVLFDSAYNKGNIGKKELSKVVSWIFCTENSRHDENTPKYMVRTLENGLCALDYETGKLHVWNSDVCTSATFGAKRLMRKSKSSIDDVVADGTKIYLKGIYVCEDHQERDSELLESFDIKGYLRKEYINLNRNEFTESGKKFLERIYEKIMESFKEALEIFANSTDKEGSVMKMGDRLLKRVDEYQDNDEEEKQDLSEAMLSTICMSFFVRLRKQAYNSVCCENKEIECQWQKLLRSLAAKIEGKESLRRGFFEKIPVYYEYELLNMWNEQKEKKSDKSFPEFLQLKGYMSFPELLQCENKIAIISERAGKHSKWIHNVIILSKDTFESFNKNVGRIDDWDDYVAENERKGSKMFEGYVRLVEKGDIKKDYDSEWQRVLRWMLANIPTSGIWSMPDGNIRMNVLSDIMTTSVFYDWNMKYLLLERMGERYSQNSGKRYVTLTWKGFEGIRIQEPPTSVCYVKRGYLAKSQKTHMLLPLIGSQIENLLGVYSDEDVIYLKQIVERFMGYYDVVPRLKEYVDMVRGDKSENLDDNLYLCFKQYTANKNLNEIKGIPEKIRKIFIGEVSAIARQLEQETEKDNKKYWYNRFVGSREKSAKDNNEEKKNLLIALLERMPAKEEVISQLVQKYMKESLEENQEENIGNEIVEEVAMVNLLVRRELFYIYKEFLFQQPKVKELKEALWGTQQEKESMIKYVSTEGQERLSKKEIGKCYDKLIDEMLEILYIKKICEQVDKLGGTEIKSNVYREGIEIL